MGPVAALALTFLKPLIDVKTERIYFLLDYAALFSDFAYLPPGTSTKANRNSEDL